MALLLYIFVYSFAAITYLPIRDRIEARAAPNVRSDGCSDVLSILGGIIPDIAKRFVIPCIVSELH